MIEKWKKGLDKRSVAGGLLTDLSKAFDCINHELLIAKLDAYGFNHNSLRTILSYLSNRKHRTKVNNSYSKWKTIKTGVPQGSILGVLLFNIYINDMLYFTEEGTLANFADDNSPNSVGKDIETVICSLTNDTNVLMQWFTDNNFVMNPDKCKLLVTNNADNASMEISGYKIEARKQVKLLGVIIDDKLEFSAHVSSIYKKASLKLHALARISNLMSKEKLRVLMKAFIESQFGYCPLIWMYHGRVLNNKINKLHERALRIVYKENDITFDELLVMDESFKVHQRNIQKLGLEMFKVKNKLSPEFIQSIFNLSNRKHCLRSESTFELSNIRTVHYGRDTISYMGPKIWEKIPKDIKNSVSLIEFKRKIKHWTPEGCECRICKTFIYQLGFLEN